MSSNNLFVDTNLPKPLKMEEVYDCFEKMKSGDMAAREKIIIHNIRLVISEVMKYLGGPYELQELVSIGMIGLIKSVDTFDISKGVNFSSYFVKCINNEILMFMRSEKRFINEVSFEQPIGRDKEDEELTILSILFDRDSDFVTEYEKNESYKIIREVINSLPEKYKNVVIKYFGFNDNDLMKQRELALELGIDQASVSRRIKKALEIIRSQLEVRGIIEISKKRLKMR